MYRTEKLICHRSLRQRQQQCFVDRVGRTLRSWIKSADGIDFIAKELDPNRPLGLGRVHVENAAAQGILAGHFDHIGGSVADRIQVPEQVVEIERLPTPQNAGEFGIVLRRALQNGRRGNRSHYDRRLPRSNLP